MMSIMAKRLRGNKGEDEADEQGWKNDWGFQLVVSGLQN